MSLEAALAALRRGEVVGVPTDTVYGVAVDPADPRAVRGLFELKGRGDHLPLAVLAASQAQVEPLVELPAWTRPLLDRCWPGPFTAVPGSKVTLAVGVGDHERGTLAVRIPDHPLLLDLLARTGPLAVTSANRSGRPPARSAAEARAALGGGAAVYLEGECPGGAPSTVADLTRSPPAVLREGPVRLDPDPSAR